jgi:hypothetical protein
MEISIKVSFMYIKLIQQNKNRLRKEESIRAPVDCDAACIREIVHLYNFSAATSFSKRVRGEL